MGHPADGDEPLLRALAKDAQDAVCQVEIVAVESDQLADAQAPRVQRFEDRPLAQGTSVVADNGGENRLHLGFA